MLTKAIAKPTSTPIDIFFRSWYLRRAETLITSNNPLYRRYTGVKLANHFDRSFPGFNCASISSISEFYNWVNDYIDACRHALWLELSEGGS